VRMRPSAGGAVQCTISTQLSEIRESQRVTVGLESFNLSELP
jgi:hypothetical protein